MCDIWKANANAQTLSSDELRPHIESIAPMGVRRIVLTGGEPLLHDNLWTLCELIEEILGAKITLLSTGLTVEKHAASIAKHIDELILSLDGPKERHDKIRRIPKAYERMRSGITAVKSYKDRVRITARSVVQKQNFRELFETIDAAKALKLDAVSFLPVDVATEAFNRGDGVTVEQISDLSLVRNEVAEFSGLVEDLIQNRAEEFESGFITESPAKMRRMVRFFQAVVGDADFPEVRCNAPWVSAVVESDGRVLPCFFQSSFGHIKEGLLDTVINSKPAVSFRKNLDVRNDSICQKCVCSLELGPRGIV
jgi:Fe-coproporphyrin III synthase